MQNNNQVFIDELQNECIYLLEVKYLCDVQSLENVTRMNLEPQERESSIRCHLTLAQLVDNLILLNVCLICKLQTTLTVDEDAYRSYLHSFELVKANVNTYTITDRSHYLMASEIERDLISSRTKEALRFKKENGIQLGRPKGPGKSKLDKFNPEIEALFANGSTQKFIASRYGTTEANLYNWMKKNGLKREKKKN